MKLFSYSFCLLEGIQEGYPFPRYLKMTLMHQISVHHFLNNVDQIQQERKSLHLNIVLHNAH